MITVIVCIPATFLLPMEVLCIIFMGQTAKMAAAAPFLMR